MQLDAVIERDEFFDAGVFALERFEQQKVGQARVFGQDGAVQIGADTVFIEGAFGIIIAVVAGATYYGAEGFGLRRERGQAGVVFIADDFAEFW